MSRRACDTGFVKVSSRAWLVIGVSVVAAAAVAFGLYERARATAASAPGMLQRLPAQTAIVLFLDFDALRADGILKLLPENKTAEDPD